MQPLPVASRPSIPMQQRSTCSCTCVVAPSAYLSGSDAGSCYRRSYAARSAPCTLTILRPRRTAVSACASVAVAEPPATASANSAPLSADAAGSQPQRPERRQDLPSQLQDVTAVLSVPNPEAPGGKTLVYLLGMSHVSAMSLQHIDQLIRMVQPEIVVVELCKDRVTGLIASDAIESVLSHVGGVKVSGLPDGKGWPTAEQLLRLCRTRPGEAVSYQDVEEDPSRILATGLFKSCRPIVYPPRRGGEFYPVFQEDKATGRLNALRPLGSVEFVLSPRVLPPVSSIDIRVDSSLRSAGVQIPEDALQAAKEAAMEATKAKEPLTTVNMLLALRADLLEAAASAGCSPDSVEVLFMGTESSYVDAVIRAVPSGKAASLSGLDSTAQGGDGEGIEPFRPQPRLVEIGLSMRVPLDKVAGNMPPRPPPEAIDARAASAIPPCKTEWRRWSEEEVQEAEKLEKEEKRPDIMAGPVGFFSMWLSGTYARFQDAAGLQVGVESCEAWHVAFRAAAAAGAAQVILGDRPSLLTARRLGGAVFATFAPLFGGACLLSLAADVAAAQGRLPDGAGLPAVLAGLAAVAASTWPVLGPILEVRALSKKSREEIEAAVQPAEALQNEGGEGIVKLWGEDALLDWPGAMQPVIHERDAFMAKSIAAAALGKAGVSPALAADAAADGSPMWRYVMAEGAPDAASPLAEGDGPYKPLKGASAVVAVVGTAHLRGMIRAWSSAIEDTSVDQYLQL